MIYPRTDLHELNCIALACSDPKFWQVTNVSLFGNKVEIGVVPPATFDSGEAQLPQAVFCFPAEEVSFSLSGAVRKKVAVFSEENPNEPGEWCRRALLLYDGESFRTLWIDRRWLTWKFTQVQLDFLRRPLLEGACRSSRSWEKNWISPFRERGGRKWDALFLTRYLTYAHYRRRMLATDPNRLAGPRKEDFLQVFPGLKRFSGREVRYIKTMGFTPDGQRPPHGILCGVLGCASSFCPYADSPNLRILGRC